MDYAKIIRHFGNQGRVAAALGITQPSISLWKTRGIPLLRQMQIQLVTGGILQASSNNLAHKPTKARALPHIGNENAPHG